MTVDEVVDRILGMIDLRSDEVPAGLEPLVRFGSATSKGRSRLPIDSLWWSNE